LVYLLKGNLASQVNLNQFYTVQTAYDKIKKELETYNGIDQDLVANILSENLIQNVVFDTETTERNLNEELGSVSATRGMIPQGLMVISRGDMVDAEKYLVLESLRKEYQSRLGSTGSFSLILLGQAIMVAITLLMLYLFMVKYRTDLGAKQLASSPSC
jgi:membrane-associated HD superfamily phosphohydrolase